MLYVYDLCFVYMRLCLCTKHAIHPETLQRPLGWPLNRLKTAYRYPLEHNHPLYDWSYTRQAERWIGGGKSLAAAWVLNSHPLKFQK